MTTTRAMPISLAAANLSRAVFGEWRAYRRRGGVHVEAHELVVKTTVPPERWPADRARSYEGHPVRWQQITVE